jgi:aminoglycoside/choline kinase family phosphotransferase
MDQPNHRYCLLLEDMGSLRMTDQVGSCSAEDAYLAVRELARLHAAHWNDPALSAEWLPGLPLMTMLSQMIYMGGWPQFWQLLGPQLPPEFEQIGASIGPALGPLLAALEDGARTLVHGDYRLENFMFDDPGKLVVLDWQIAHSGGGGQDLAYFIAQNLAADARRELEQGLIGAYYETLVAEGVAGYSFERCLRDYRTGLLVGMVIPVNGVRAFQEVSATGGGDALTDEQRELVGRALESGFALIQTMTERNVAAIFDNNAHELLEELAASSAASS